LKLLKLFHRNDHHIETMCRTQHLGRYLKGQGHSMTLQQNSVQPITSLFKLDFKTFLKKWSPHWDDVSRTTFGSLPWRSRSQHDLAAKSCPAHNFLIWSQILKLFHRNDQHIKTMCREQHLGHYLEGQGHNMTLQQNCVRPITFFWCRIKKFFHRNDHHIETMCRVHHLGCYLEGQGHSMTLQQNRIQLITLLFEVGFYNHFWQITSLCPKPIRGALPGSTGSCLYLFVVYNVTFTEWKKLIWNFTDGYIL